jgi:hypothetical protein
MSAWSSEGGEFELAALVPRLLLPKSGVETFRVNGHVFSTRLGAFAVIPRHATCFKTGVRRFLAYAACPPHIHRMKQALPKGQHVGAD